ncbi:retrovirus-related pol polyprotein from transposon TNT 1-94 [Tanacetum coccineum]|uniref:Retrovirus-related pol polyprotein from transposon TNT 1-94 n=1 Tax=Tanacetum coccineum TaxID=301880 RepID=A0ABQ4X5C7_9ASTR
MESERYLLNYQGSGVGVDTVYPRHRYAISSLMDTTYWLSEQNYILNALDDSLYDIYSTFATAREIWKSLEKKYRTQVACSKKFVVGKFLNFKMNDAKPIVKQVEELQIILHEMEVEGMGINSNFLVGSIIEKLPQSWKNFKLYLKHLTDDMSFEQLGLKIYVEEDNRMNEKANTNSIEPNANMVGESSSKSKSNHKNKGKNGGSGQKHNKDGKKDYAQQKNNNFKNVYHCWVCGKPRHKAKDCRHKKEYGGGNSGGNSNQENHVESPKEFAGVIESFLTTNIVDWWLDTGATKHICNSRRMFVSYQKGNESEPMFMGNETCSKIKRKGKVILKLTSGKDLDKEKQISNARKRVIDNQLSQDQTDNNSKVPQENVEPRRSKRAKVTEDFGPDYMTYIVNEEPQTYKAAMESSKAPYWKEAIQSKIYSIVHNNTWKLVDLPSRHKLIGHTWIFKKKLRPDGTIEKYKARLVAKGYRQKEDDMLIMGTNMDVINQTKKIRHSSFDMKDMGEADVILSIRIQKNSDGYILTQSHYIEKTHKKFRHYDDRPVVTPFDPKVQLKKNKGQSVSQLHYTQVLGSLMYIMNCTRPDLAYSVSRLSRYSHNPGRDHWDALVRVLQYLKHTMAYGLHYTKYPLVLEGYCDANWISSHNEGKFISGYVFTLGGAAVSWKSSKQAVYTRSTMEAEFLAIDKAAEEAEWLRSFLEGIPLWPKPVTAMCIHCDSMAALTRAKNHIYNGKSRHIRHRHNTIEDLLRNGIISIDYVKSKENIADPLKKGLCKEQACLIAMVAVISVEKVSLSEPSRLFCHWVVAKMSLIAPFYEPMQPFEEA